MGRTVKVKKAENTITENQTRTMACDRCIAWRPGLLTCTWCVEQMIKKCHALSFTGVGRSACVMGLGVVWTWPDTVEFSIL